MFAPPLSWTIISALKLTTNHATKLNNDDKTDSASVSNIESSRSRGSSVSSGNNENCRRKDDDEETKAATKRKKENTRQQLSFLRDTDESSTTIEKSSEDYDVKQTFSDHSNKREYKTKLNYNTKNSSNSYFKDTYRMSMHDATLRHRKVRTK